MPAIKTNILSDETSEQVAVAMMPPTKKGRRIRVPGRSGTFEVTYVDLHLEKGTEVQDVFVTGT